MILPRELGREIGRWTDIDTLEALFWVFGDKQGLANEQHRRWKARVAPLERAINEKPGVIYVRDTFKSEGNTNRYFRLCSELFWEYEGENLYVFDRTMWDVWDANKIPAILMKTDSQEFEMLDTLAHGRRPVDLIDSNYIRTPLPMKPGRTILVLVPKCIDVASMIEYSDWWNKRELSYRVIDVAWRDVAHMPNVVMSNDQITRGTCIATDQQVEQRLEYSGPTVQTPSAGNK